MHRAPRAVAGSLLLLAATACLPDEAPYEKFQPPRAMRDRLDDPRFAKCVDEASAPYRLTIRGLHACFDTEWERLDALLKQAFARALVASNGDPAFRADQAEWSERMGERCDAENPHHEGWGWIFDLRSCHHDEMKRRILWLEEVSSRRGSPTGT